MSDKMIIALDFDGTCVEHEYPDIGPDVPYAEVIIKALQMTGCHFFLWTMRSGMHLKDARDWFGLRDIPLVGLNVNPWQSTWATGPKQHAEIYIDDAGFGCPLVRPPDKRPYVDWLAVAKEFGITT